MAPGATVADLKAQLAPRTGVAIAEQKLVYKQVCELEAIGPHPSMAPAEMTALPKMDSK
jgi:hypothetical protein